MLVWVVVGIGYLVLCVVWFFCLLLVVLYEFVVYCFCVVWIVFCGGMIVLFLLSVCDSCCGLVGLNLIVFLVW